MATLSAANSQLSLSVQGLYSSPQTIQGFLVDDAFMTQAAQQAETFMGVDGEFSAGKIFVPYTMTISLQSNSPSIAIFETVRNQQDAVGDLYRFDGTVFLPGLGLIYTLDKGFLKAAPAMPAVKKTLGGGIVYEIEWKRIISAPGGSL